MGKATIKDVAAKAGVSIATVSNVFSGRKPVGEEVSLRVREVADELGYTLNRAASQLRTGKVRVIGILVPNLNDTFFTALVSRIEVLAGAAGYQVLIVSAHDNFTHESAQLNALLGWKPSGIVAIPCTNTIPEPLRRVFGSLPIVLADRIGEDNLPVDTITVDNYTAGREAAEHLLSNGHKKLAIVSSVTEFRPIEDRIRGVKDACDAYLCAQPEVIEVGVDVDAGSNYLGQWLDMHDHPSAIIATTNVTTLATLSALASRSIETPDAISLIGFDDYAWMTARKTPLTAVRQPISDIAASIWRCLTNRMGANDLPKQNTVLQGELILRNSVSPLN